MKKNKAHLHQAKDTTDMGLLNSFIKHLRLLENFWSVYFICKNTKGHKGLSHKVLVAILYYKI